MKPLVGSGGQLSARAAEMPKIVSAVTSHKRFVLFRVGFACNGSLA
jgi:hypothetical protein